MHLPVGPEASGALEAFKATRPQTKRPMVEFPCRAITTSDGTIGAPVHHPRPQRARPAPGRGIGAKQGRGQDVQEG